MTLVGKTEATCDRCKHVELLDGHDPRVASWVQLDVETYGMWLFPLDGTTHCGQAVTQHKLLCPACASAFVSWMCPEQLVKLRAALRQLATDLEGLEAYSKGRKTSAGKASAESLNYALGRVQGLLNGKVDS